MKTNIFSSALLKKSAKFASLALAGALTLSLAACGGSPAPSSSSTPSSSEGEAPAAVLKVGATPAPHAEILEIIAPILEKEGVKLEIVDFSDYDLPNLALSDGSIDANFFQHQPFLDVFNEKNGTDLIAVADVHFEPLGIYPSKAASLEELPDGAQIAIPNDTSNEARALQLLADNGLITLKEGAGLAATPRDIVENPKNLTFVEVQAAQVVRTLPDVELAVINGNYAVEAGLAATVLTSEAKDSEGAATYANILVVRKEDENRPEILRLVAALQSEEVKAFINSTYNGVVVPMF